MNMTTDSGNYTVTTGFYTGSTLNTTAGTGGWNGTTYTAGIELSTELSQCPEKTPTRAFFLMKAPTTLKNLRSPVDTSSRNLERYRGNRRLERNLHLLLHNLPLELHHHLGARSPNTFRYEILFIEIFNLDIVATFGKLQ